MDAFFINELCNVLKREHANTHEVNISRARLDDSSDKVHSSTPGTTEMLHNAPYVSSTVGAYDYVHISKVGQLAIYSLEAETRTICPASINDQVCPSS